MLQHGCRLETSRRNISQHCLTTMLVSLCLYSGLSVCLYLYLSLSLSLLITKLTPWMPSRRLFTVEQYLMSQPGQIGIHPLPRFYQPHLFMIIIFEPRHDKTNKMAVRPAKTQISLGIRPVWSESSLSAWRNLGSLATHWAHSGDSGQTGRMPRLIWVFAGRTHFVGFVMSRLISPNMGLSLHHVNGTVAISVFFQAFLSNTYKNP